MKKLIAIVCVLKMCAGAVYADQMNMQNQRVLNGIDIKNFAQEFKRNVQGSFILDSSHMQTIGNRQVPQLCLTLNNTSLVDTFTQKTGANATIFVAADGDFVRIATSLKKEDGSSAVGTILDRNSPAYKSLIQSKSYSGRTLLFGKNYVAQYEPLEDAEGNTVGALFIAVPIE